MMLTHAEVEEFYSNPSVWGYRLAPVLAQLTHRTAKRALCFDLPSVPEGAVRNPQYAGLEDVGRKIGLSEAYVARLDDQ
ncbi:MULTISPECIES: hypothetical protein [Bradyrhizobium]